MELKKLLKKYLTHILTISLVFTTATAGYFINETIVTNNELSSLQVQFDKQVGINLDLSAVISKLETDKTNLTTELTSLTKTYNDLLTVKQNLEKNIVDLEAEKEALNQDIIDLNTEITTLEADIATLQTRITGLNSQIAASAAALSSLSSQLSSLSSQNSQLSSQVSALTVQVNNYVIENASQIDFSTLNQISQLILKANIRVVVPVVGGTSNGSGIIYKYTASGNKYYALTNNHVVQNQTNGSQMKVLNYAGIEFNAVKVAFNDNADLAIIEISGNSSTNFHVLELEASNYVIPIDTKVISLGGPSLQLNTITLGKITNNNTTVAVAGDKTYNGVLAHNAVINKGSSGGALVGFNNKIVGINFAGDFTNQPDPQPFPFQNVNGFAIDLAKIHALLGAGENWSLS